MLTGVSTIDKNVNLINVWLKEITRELPGTDREQAWLYLRAVLQTLRDRLGNSEAAAFAAQLPTLVRGLFYEAWQPAKPPQKWRHRRDYIAAVQEKIRGSNNIDPEQTVRVILKVVGNHIGDEEMEKVKSMHNKDMWSLWPPIHPFSTRLRHQLKNSRTTGSQMSLLNSV